MEALAPAITPAAANPPLALLRRLADPVMPSAADNLDVVRRFVVAGVSDDAPDLSQRQLGVFLTVYLSDPPHTPGSLATTLAVTKPVITRALDRLCALNFVRRDLDPDDGRCRFVRRTIAGAAYLRRLRANLDQAQAGG